MLILEFICLLLVFEVCCVFWGWVLWFFCILWGLICWVGCCGDFKIVEIGDELIEEMFINKFCI